MKLPNLIIAGAPKAGSSSLYNWLAAHPEVYGAPCKETFYFIDHNSSLLKPEANYNFHGLDLYESFFPNCPANAKVIFEATPHYIYQKTALEFFASCDPQPHIIFLLRKPSKRIFSSFSYVQNYIGKLDTNLTFEQVTNLLLDETGTLVQELDYPPDSFFYTFLKDQLPNNCYYNFLAAWAKQFSKEKIHIILFEEMVANPKNTLIKLAKNLGIDANFYNQFYFDQRNKTVAIKNRYIHQLVQKLAYYLASKEIKTFLENYRIVKLLKSLYLRSNTSKVQSAPSESIARLDDYFRPYNQQLAEAFNLELDLWN